MLESPDRDAILLSANEEVYELLQTPQQGLGNEEVERRLEQFGPNVIASAKAYPLWRLLIDQLASPLIYVLLVAGAITLLMRDYKDSIVILAVVVLNGTIGFIQEWKASRAIESLQQLTEPHAHLRREGKVVTVERRQIVPGDILILEQGTRLAADVRLVRAVELSTDESLLTGESLAVEKTAAPLSASTSLPAEMRNMAFAGSLVVEGRGLGIVVATGTSSELGKISTAMTEVEKVQTPLQARLHRFANQITIAIMSLSVIVGIIGLLQGMTVLEVFLVAVALAVSAIPEGLPIVVTLVLSMGVRRMAHQQALVRRLPAAETMGSIDVICTDKTGTITENQMTVRFMAWGSWAVEADSEGLCTISEEHIRTCASDPDELKPTLDSLERLLRISVYCNNAEYDAEAEEEDRFRGGPTEVALLKAAVVLTPHLLHEREIYSPVSEVPFSSARKFMATVHELEGEQVMLAKGSPEAILQRCSTQWTAEGDQPLNTEHWLQVANAQATEGQRVIAMARRTWPSRAITEAEVKDLTFVGLVGIVDPPRRGAAEAVEGCKQAGIRVVMITGDHAATARAIAREVGIMDFADGYELAEEDPRIMTGRELDALNDEELAVRLDEVQCYARVTPHHKLRIVQQLQEHGKTVAITGDGVNDAPALRRAHIGVAMGKGGTDAAREASDVVITDDSFSTIYEAVKQGRYIFENIRKVTLFLLATGVSEVLAILFCLAAGFGLPYSAAQILWINLVTNGLQDVALAAEQGEDFVLKRKPRGASMQIIDRVMVQHMVVVMVVFGLSVAAVFRYAQLNPAEGVDAGAYASTVAMTSMVMLQMLNVFVCRSLVEPFYRIPLRQNPWVLAAVLASTGAQLALLYWPPLQRVFGTVPISADKWLIVMGIAVLGLVALETSKWWARRTGVYRQG